MAVKDAIKKDQRALALIEEALKKGPLTAQSTGAAVKAAERLLKIAGFDVAVPDTSFDEKSLAALSQLDAAMGNPADGALDEKTFADLKQIIGRIRAHADNDAFITRGQAGDKVKKVQDELEKLGYLKQATGVFDADTQEAVRQYKRDLGVKAAPDFVGKYSGRHLPRDLEALQHAPYKSRVTKPTKERASLDEATAKAVQEGLGPDTPKRVVKNVQAYLRNAGFNPGKLDGKLDGRTTKMVELFQHMNGLEQTGTVDEKTWAALHALRFEAKNGTSPQQSLGERSAAVVHSEKLLRELGYKHVKADGVFDEATQKASRAFEQKYRGLGKDGKIGKEQLERMETLVNAKRHPGSGPLARKGDAGKPISQLQRRLKSLGYRTGGVDGKFGQQTARAVRAFQRDYRLQVDGIVGKQTWRMLGIKAKGEVKTPGGVGGVGGLGASAIGRRLADAARSVAESMGGYTSHGLCATGVAAAIQRVYGFHVGGNGNQIDENLPRDKFRQVNLSLAEALKIPGAIITWEHTGTPLGGLYGHVAISWGDGHTTSSDFIEPYTTGNGRYGMKVFLPR